jgi:hypothetical protein
MKKILSITFLAAMIGIAGCDSNDPPPPIPENPTPLPDTAQVQVVHAVADAPNVTVSVGGPPPAGSAFDGLEFKNAASGNFAPGTFSVSVDANLADGTAVNVIPPTDIDFVVDTRTIIIATGAVGGITPVVLTQDVADFAANGESALRVAHAAVGVGAVDVYATAPGADLAASAPVATIAFQEGSDLLTVPPGDYQLRVTPAGDPATVVFDAGTTTLVGGEDLLAVAVNNTTASSQAITLVVANSTDGEVAEVQDVAAEGDLRVVHASPDAGPVDVLADGAVVVANAPYEAVATLDDLPAATYDIEVRPTGGDETTTVFQADVALDAGVAADAIAIGSVADPVAIEGTEFTVLVAADDPRSIATDSKLRLIHGSVAAEAVDVFVVATGAPVTGVTPDAAGVVLGGNSGYGLIAPGAYDVVVTPAGDDTVEALRLPVTLAAGDVITGIVIDDIAAPGTFKAIVLDDSPMAMPPM